MTMPSIVGLHRYPIKGLSAQPLTSCEVEAGRPLRDDRVFALVRPGVTVDIDEPAWAKKGMFAMLMLDEQLASVRTFLDMATLQFAATRNDVVVAEGNLADPIDRETLERFFWTLLPGFPSPPRLVRSKGGHFMDKPDSVISLVNLATVRDLERRWNTRIDPMRFRANITIDGAEPWEEFDWVGHCITVGGTVLKVDRRNGRCGATNVDPSTGQRNRDIPRKLRATFGHKDLGTYLTVQSGGTIAVGESFEAPAVERAAHATGDGLHARRSARRQYICEGCYHIYDEELGLPDKGIAPGTPFEAIPDDWCCPDCAIGKRSYAPVPPGAAQGAQG